LAHPPVFAEASAFKTFQRDEPTRQSLPFQRTRDNASKCSNRRQPPPKWQRRCKRSSSIHIFRGFAPNNSSTNFFASQRHRMIEMNRRKISKIAVFAVSGT
jgi:hypothetical protein